MVTEIFWSITIVLTLVAVFVLVQGIRDAETVFEPVSPIVFALALMIIPYVLSRAVETLIGGGQ